VQDVSHRTSLQPGIPKFLMQQQHQKNEEKERNMHDPNMVGMIVFSVQVVCCPLTYLEKYLTKRKN